MADILGIHHVTAICGEPQENLDFYTGLLGLRLVKKTVNQDAPDTYHFYYADADGNPGTDITFFPFRNSPPGRLGHGLGVEIALAIPDGSFDYWLARLKEAGVTIAGDEMRRGEHAMLFSDPHGQKLALVESKAERTFRAWDRSTVPADKQIVGLHAVRAWEHDIEVTAAFLTSVLEFTDYGVEDGWHRFGVDGGGSGKHIEFKATPDAPRGAWGVGTMHHVAWRTADVDIEMKIRERIEKAHRRPTELIDRFWFKSVYFLEPGGVLFELATDPPGFAIDEEPEHLGESLILPPWLEAHRREIEAILPPVVGPGAEVRK